MSIWSDLSINKFKSRTTEYSDVVEIDYYETECGNEIYSYGLLENLTMYNCCGVEQVYDEMWRDR